MREQALLAVQLPTAICLLPTPLVLQLQVPGRAFGDAEAGGDELGGVGRLERGLRLALRERVRRGRLLAPVQLDYLLADEEAVEDDGEADHEGDEAGHPDAPDDLRVGGRV